MTAHVPVLLKEVIELISPKEGEIIIDGTVGGGGHARELLKAIGEKGKLILIDWDRNAISKLKEEFKNNPNVICINSNYANLPEILKKYNLPPADGLLLDLGFSSDQLEAGRGFSFRQDEPLLMTYSDDAQSFRDFLKSAAVSEISEIINKFGEERYAQKIAEAIFENKTRISTSLELAKIIQAAVPRSYERGRIHPATRTFQAFRIYLNKELENLERVLNSLDQMLKPMGRAAIISFHSLEDRIVKNIFRELAKKGRMKILTKKPIIASLEEIKINPHSRSAKLRVGIVT